MEDFTMRTITEKSEDGKIEVSRSRNSMGFASISIKVVGKCGISFTNEHENDGYEQQALELARLIDKIASNSCLLSEPQKGDK